MAKKEVTVSGQVAREYCRRFPKTPTNTLAKKAYKENREVWSTFNACACAIRHVRGNRGKDKRATSADKSLFRENGNSAAVVVPKLPEGITELVEWQAEKVDTAGLWLILSDIHIPFYDKKSVDLVLKEAKRRKIAGILLNGDVMDGHAISHWQRDPRKRDFSKEIEMVREFTRYIRYEFKKCEIVYKQGNHDERVDQYLQQKAPELLDMECLQFGELTHSDKHDIRVVGEKRPILLGKLWVVHGHEWRSGLSSPVNPARGLYLKTKVSALCGHLHQSSSHSESDLSGHVTTCWSTGCLCDLHPLYAPINRWNRGAAFVEVGKDGGFEVNNFRIINGKMYS